MADQKTTLGVWVNLLTKSTLTIIAAALLSISIAWQNVHAATLTVNDSGDQIVANSVGGTCTLREAILAINQGSLIVNDASGATGCINSGSGFGTNDQILFDADRTITTGFPEGGLFITNSVLINPAGPNQQNITFNANNRSRHFSILPPQDSTPNPIISVGFNNIVFTNGRAETDATFGGSLVIQNSNVSINNSTFTNNFATNNSGAIFISTQLGSNTSTLNIDNSTVSNNRSDGNPGAIFAASQNASVTVNLRNTTIANNSAPNVGGVRIFGGATNINLTNSIIADSTNANCILESGGTITSDSQSIIEGDNCGSGARTIDPGLLSLSNNGGGTLTHALALESPAVNRGNNSNCLATDQRGEPRPSTSADRCDVGAFEQNESDRDRLNASFIIIPISNNRAVVAPL